MVLHKAYLQYANNQASL